MNLWECDHPGCYRTVVGVGGAIGLRAIGWYFAVGPRIFCPAHRPDADRARSRWLGCEIKDNCSICRATETAEAIQFVLEGLPDAR